MNKKAQSWSNLLVGGVFAIVLVGLLTSFAMQMLGDQRDDMTMGSDEQGAVNQTITALTAVPAKLPMIVGVIVIAVVIGLLFFAFGRVQ